MRDFTVHVDGIGDVCSLACFDLARHGNAKYGSPVSGKKVRPMIWVHTVPRCEAMSSNFGGECCSCVG